MARRGPGAAVPVGPGADMPATTALAAVAGTAHEGIASSLIDWQHRHGRHDLPWQGSRDPYRVWVSEVMLQQTQVATVLAYYPRFVARFPDVRSLAAASLDEVLALWAGLGYYSRARHLHRAAQQVMVAHGGHFPRDRAGLETLPGVGRSTAAAIAAFCYGERAAILDGNVKRVLTRVLGFGADLAQPANERALWALAEGLLPASGIEAYTQGLMDLGASLCSARAPECGSCPLAAACIAQRQGDPARYPVKTRRLRRSRRENWWLWLEGAAGVWLQQRPSRGVWGGLWTLPLFDDEAGLHAAVARLGRGLKPEALPTIEHALTHFDWVLHSRRLWLADAVPGATVAGMFGSPADGEGRWVARDALADHALPAPLRRLLSTPPGASFS